MEGLVSDILALSTIIDYRQILSKIISNRKGEAIRDSLSLYDAGNAHRYMSCTKEEGRTALQPRSWNEDEKAAERDVDEDDPC